jgi:hypothetical protein
VSGCPCCRVLYQQIGETRADERTQVARRLRHKWGMTVRAMQYAATPEAREVLQIRADALKEAIDLALDPKLRMTA